MKLLITGVGGWVGQALAERCEALGHAVRGAVRHAGAAPVSEPVVMPGLETAVDWTDALRGVECVVHLAARVHVMDERSADPLAAFRTVNTQATLSLARQAAAAGVRRLVFVSSIKVNGETTAPGHAFRHDDSPAPQDAYGQSKREAEDGLRVLAARTGLEVVIVRPPLVYGPGVKANFAALMAAVRRGVPLPLACVTGNRRSFVALDNLVDLLMTCIEHEAAVNQTFLACDGEDLSTAELLRRLGKAMGRPARLFPVPASLLVHAASLLGRGEAVRRLTGNLQVDGGHARRMLGWTPPLGVDEALRRAVSRMETP